jgi:putative transposase
MSISSAREAIPGTYFLTWNCYLKKNLLQSVRMAELQIELIIEYRDQGKFEVHEFVVMPSHVHALLTPARGMTIERCVQLTRGRLSFEAGKRFQLRCEIWQPSFQDRRIRSAAEYQKYAEYIRQNPVEAGLCQSPEEFPFSSASGKYRLDPIPQRLKPAVNSAGMQG